MNDEHFSHHAITKPKTDCLPMIADVAEEIGFSVPFCRYSQVEAIRIVEAVIESFARNRLRDGFSDEEGSPSNKVFFFLLNFLPEATKAEILQKRSLFKAEMEDMESML